MKDSLMSFDYAIKYLLKDKGDYSIVEGFISALLKTQGYKPVKIIGLLEAESNKEDSKGKRSLADVVVEDEDHQKYIVEIERNMKDSFIHKACFNTSRFIVDSVPKGVDYNHIVKVFHISLLYFTIGNGTVYYGKTIIHEIETEEKLTVHIINQKTGKEFDATDILPEYFFISVPAFNDRIEREIDEWLYVMKHDNVLDTFRSPYMKQVAEKLSFLKMTMAERYEYYYNQKKVISEEDEYRTIRSKSLKEGKALGIEEGKALGIEEGKALGVEEGIEKTALTMLGLNVDIKTIAQYTNLSLEHIQNLKSLKVA